MVTSKSVSKEIEMSKAENILAALGGADNLVELEPCITRLRVEVVDPSLVDEAALKANGSYGVVRSGNAVQVVVGPEADTLASEIGDLR
ncbi:MULTISPECIES: PTS glucose/sucrose transporter subunit IIB [unclassified Cellulomonas]|uniref:PTS glucose/sucrose transporter subunit IIB n=1 Tax=unclassified Cellulomonas TaxID=2620175 RepID=UPI000B1B0519|nr:PTS glucose/sucrose transporter subunit IIB [Cellulomonas sp. SG140]BDO41201.1 PTS sugar transporter [Cellulomonas sp. NTE-D12]